MYKILLLTDFSAASRHAIAFTQALFADTAATFCLLNTYLVEPEIDYSSVMLLEERRRAIEAGMQTFRQSITQQPEPEYHTYTTKVMLGDPVGAVRQLLSEEFFNLVVLGASGSGNSQLFGSVATGLVRQATTNVLVVPATAPIRPLEHAVLATDYTSVNNRESLTILTDLLSRKAAELTLLTIENTDHPETLASEPNRQYVLSAFENIPSETYTIHDTDVLHGIQDYLAVHTVDLLAMLPHHTSFMDVIFNRSLSRAVAYRPTVPLLTLYDAPAASASDDSAANRVPFTTYL
ncbi:universal stress protein [Spirosoma sp. SC4-14]|uniref:universal stress protein n=1 Tax=Spirosoma sp. SC4-14 TaxID=3128900 RepID=UPI0030D1B95A